MSIASPTLRSSSSTLPGPSLRRSATSMRERPSTAETCTGTSNTASRSDAPMLIVSMSVSGDSGAGRGAVISPAAPRSGSGTLDSLSLIAQISRGSVGYCAAGGDVAAHRVADGAFGRGTIAHDAAVGPFDAAIAGRDLRLGEHDEASVEAAHAGNLVELLARLRVQRVVDAHDHVRRADQMGEAVAGEGGDLDEGRAGDQLGRKLARDGHVDGFRLDAPLDRGETPEQALEPLRDAPERRGEAPFFVGPRLRLGGGKAVAIGLRPYLRERRLVRRQCDGALAPVGRFARAEVHVEHEFGARAHQ